jgi:hypothetical protein
MKLQPPSPLQRRCIIAATVDDLVPCPRGYRSKAGIFDRRTTGALLRNGGLRCIANGRLTAVAANRSVAEPAHHATAADSGSRQVEQGGSVDDGHRHQRPGLHPHANYDTLAEREMDMGDRIDRLMEE